MDLYEALEKRRTIRDFSDREVCDEVLEKILSAAFKAPTNDHLRQFEFIVVRGRENISRIISPVTKNTAAISNGIGMVEIVMIRIDVNRFIFIRFMEDVCGGTPRICQKESRPCGRTDQRGWLRG